MALLSTIASLESTRLTNCSALISKEPGTDYGNSERRIEVDYSELSAQSVTKSRREAFGDRNAAGYLTYAQTGVADRVVISSQGDVTVAQGTEPGEYVTALSISELGGPTIRCTLTVTVWSSAWAYPADSASCTV